jgi:CDP-diacylglycerol---serine O-phosphatidyltransferase
MNIKRHIPNLITCFNLLCGIIAIILIFQDKLNYAAFFIIAAAIFDFLDGFVARLVNGYSLMGKELDSLADMVSFGLTPGFIMYHYIQLALPETVFLFAGLNLISILVFIIAIFSALRLAKFNIDERQSENFIGLPTPANAMFFISLPLVLQYGDAHSPVFKMVEFAVSNTYAILLLVFIFSFLMVSPFGLFSLKFKGFGFERNKIKYVFLAGSFILILFFKILSLPLIILYYISLSLILNQFFQKN